MKILNKKGWHPATFRDQEKVWKAEQADAAEKKRVEELQKKLHEERAHLELRQLQVDAGLAPKQQRLEFLYDSGLQVGKPSTEDYLLGQPVEETKKDAAISRTSETPGALFVKSEEPVNKNDSWRKLHDDPLLAIRQQEQAALARIRNNPVKMETLKKQALSSVASKKVEKRRLKELKRAERKKRRAEKKRKKRAGSASGDSSDSSEEDRDQKSKSQGRTPRRLEEGPKDGSPLHPSTERQKVNRPGSRGDHESNGNRRDGWGREQSEYRHDRGGSDGRGREHSDGRGSWGRGHRERSYSRVRGEDAAERRVSNGHQRDRSSEEVVKKRGRHDTPSGSEAEEEKQPTRPDSERAGPAFGLSYGRVKPVTVALKTEVKEEPAAPAVEALVRRAPHKVGKLTEEERARRLAEMTADAEVHEEQRWVRIKKEAEKDAKLAELEKGAEGKKTFLDEAGRGIYGAEKKGSIEESVRRRAHYRESGGKETTNAFRR